MMKSVKAIVTAGLLAFLVGGGVVLPMQDAEAATWCRNVYTNGVYKRICTTRPGDRDGYRHGYRGDHRYGYRNHNRPRYETVCRTYWRDGERYRNCRRVPARW